MTALCRKSKILASQIVSINLYGIDTLPALGKESRIKRLTWLPFFKRCMLFSEIKGLNPGKSMFVVDLNSKSTAFRYH